MAAAPPILAALGHELRTPVASILGATAVLQRPEELDAQTRQRLLGIVSAEAHRLSRMLDELLAAGTEASAAIEPETLDIATLAREAIDTARLSGRHGDRIAVELRGPGHAWAQGHADSVTRILTNLLDNAARHASERIVVETDPRPDQVRLAVADDGPGVPEDLAPTIFERLGRSSEGRTGLGLWLSSELAARMGGRLRLDATVDVGARFVLELPPASP